MKLIVGLGNPGSNAVKLIAGLGNPGPKYRDTRHNVGFAVIDELARREAVVFEAAPTDALLARARALGGGTLLAKPLKFMNHSGYPVAELARYFRIALPDLLVVVDDADLPLGRLRARARGSAGGHNGLRSIIEQLGTTEFARLRIGVGRGDDRRDLAAHVLSRFEAEEQAVVEAAIARAADAAGLFAESGIAAVMNAYNAAESAGPDENAVES